MLSTHHPCSPTAKPRMGTRIGLHHSPACDSTSSIKPFAYPLFSASTVNIPVVHGEHTPVRPNVTSTTRDVQIRNERVLDWPQLRIRRKPTSTIENKRSLEDKFTGEPGSYVRQPVKAVHRISAALTRKRRGIEPPGVAMATVTGTRSSSDLVTVAPSNGLGTTFDLHSDIQPSLMRIATNPFIRRRYSSDGTQPYLVDNEMSVELTVLIYAILVASASKRQNYGRSSQCSVNSSDTDVSDVSYCTQPAGRTWDTNGIAYRLPGSTTLKQPLRDGRHSTGTIKRASKSDSLFQPLREPRRSSVLTDIQRSAKQTLISLRKAWRGSAGNLSDSVNSSGLRESHLEKTVVNVDGRSSLMHYRKAESLFKISPQAVTGVACSPQRRIKRNVDLVRRDLQQPFGLFVVKTEKGFQVSRLSEHLKTTSSANLHCGDELLEANGVACADMSINELRQLFSRCTTLALRVESIIS
ncbi:uncharacterized protein DEA37_0013650 [Paragonimus westermani]|uniref:PDZ domain-containing protein n=1 Tax=Paragonimus westermani TaxID=34504 RepID=A0A5J4NJL7_9TREM|nr:uncharacterized protein DEA37_0013650 [Paragonimus westermani]